MRADIVRLLSSCSRTLPGHPDKWMLGPMGKRLWVDYLDGAPGFSGRVDFIHKMNLPLLFSVRFAGEEEGAFSPARVQWRVNESRVYARRGDYTFFERKLITWEDEALSCQVWENKGNKPLTLELCLPEGAALGVPYRFPVCLHGVSPVMLAGSTASWSNGQLTIGPGEKRVFLLAAAVGLSGEESELARRLSALLKEEDPQGLMDKKAHENARWLDSVPDFECEDRQITACWYYRFYLMRKNLAEPGLGRLPGHCLYEGRSHRMEKTPCQASGWEFSRVIPLSVPLQAMDARWTKDGQAARDALGALIHCVDENGVFAVTSVDACQKEYAHFAAWALYQYYLVSGDTAFILAVLPAFKRDARNVYESTRKGDALQIERTHALTGKEYQPSFWFFTQDCFPASVRPAREGYTPLKRVDRSVYTYLNFTALSRLCRVLRDGDEGYFAGEALKIKRDILEKMWDSPSRCFYDLHHETDEKAYVKNIVAIYPLWADMTEETHLPILEYLLSPSYFALGSGFASCASDCPVFSSNGGWRGNYFKGPHGCMWNGPSWPYTTGIALDALARQSKKHGHAYDAAFEKHLQEYTLEHFRAGDSAVPCLVEFYDSKTGAPLSEEADYFHSFYIDLIVRHLAGIEPTEKGVGLHPLRTERSYFSLLGLNVRGTNVDVYYQKKDGLRYPYPAGYTVFANGKLCYQGSGKEPVFLFPYPEEDPDAKENG